MSMQITPQNTALVLIDLQHGIVGMPVVPHTAASVIDNARRMADAFRAKGAPVVYVRVDLAEMQSLAVDISHADPNAPPPPAVASEIVPEAGLQEGDTLVTKRHWSAFGQTGLKEALHDRGVDTIILAGLVTNFGVESSARHAVAYGFHVVLAEDACSALDAEAHRFAFESIFPLMARVRTAQEIINALQ